VHHEYGRLTLATAGLLFLITACMFVIFFLNQLICDHTSFRNVFVRFSSDFLKMTFFVNLIFVTFSLVHFTKFCKFGLCTAVQQTIYSLSVSKLNYYILRRQCHSSNSETMLLLLRPSGSMQHFRITNPFLNSATLLISGACHKYTKHKHDSVYITLKPKYGENHSKSTSEFSVHYKKTSTQ